MANKLLRIDIIATTRDVDNVTAWLFQEAPFGWEEEPAPGGQLFRVHLEDPAHGQNLISGLSSRFPEAVVTSSEIENKDWALAWREFFTPVKAGEDFLVLAPWMEKERAETDRIPIIIEPKTAFGTGHHATTALCLEVLSGLHRRGRVGPGMRFLDLGTGSGVLGLACAKLGLTGVGLDIDPLAVDNTLENKAINGVGDEFQVGLGDLSVLPGLAGMEPFQLILANILAGPLVSLAPGLVSRMDHKGEGKGGALVLSGILNTQADTVVRAYAEQGLPDPERLTRDEWVALVW